MLSLPDEFSRQFNSVLDKGQYPENIKHFYRKWLRFYWDFCHKYHHDPFNPSSLPLFLNKLEQKRQSDQQREQARQAVELFYQAQATALVKDTDLQTLSRQTLSTQSPPMPYVSHQESAPESTQFIRQSHHRSVPREKTRPSISHNNFPQIADAEKSYRIQLGHSLR